jgi:hypothetical protein
VSKETYCSVKRDLLQCQKRSRDLLYCEKRPAVKMTRDFGDLSVDGSGFRV